MVIILYFNQKATAAKTEQVLNVSARFSAAVR